MRDLQPADTAAESGYETGGNAVASGQGGARRVGFGLEYDFSSRFSETETESFAAAGVVRTADGAEIRFELGFEMSRSYTESVSVSVRAGGRRKPQVATPMTASTATAEANRRTCGDRQPDAGAASTAASACASSVAVCQRWAGSSCRQRAMADSMHVPCRA